MRASKRQQSDRRPDTGGSAARQAAAQQPKKPYRKPVLAKYEQLHGIGLGSA
jgi:hypothetical protein